MKEFYCRTFDCPYYDNSCSKEIVTIKDGKCEAYKSERRKRKELEKKEKQISFAFIPQQLKLSFLEKKVEES